MLPKGLKLNLVPKDPKLKLVPKGPKLKLVPKGPKLKLVPKGPKLNLVPKGLTLKLVLQILVRAVVENLTDNRGEQAASLRPSLQELLGRVTSRHSTDSQIWQQYARLYGDGHSTNPEDNEKALQFLSKAHRCEVQASGWEKDPGAFKDVVSRAVDIGNVTISCSKKKSNPQEALQMLSSTRLSLRSLATKAKQMHTDVASGLIHADLRDGVTELEQLITELQELSGTLRGQSE
ncbi:tetratricopeptide repeat protein 27-like [Centroberyx affinis]|uniref:tetratricopeptide repeat protein 27-like n=1 Tax=Centroberyx affinis TaxID=166261 RepID=UPI003A5BAA90